MDRPQVHWFFQRVAVTSPVMRIFFELSGGLAFLLRRFHLIQPEYVVTPPAVYTGFPLVGVELTDGTGATRWQLQSIPADLYSAPRRNGVVMKTETAPADAGGLGVNMSAVFKPRSNTINLFYDTGENIFIRLSGMELLTPPGYLCPNFIDLAVEGVYIP